MKIYEYVMNVERLKTVERKVSYNGNDIYALTFYSGVWLTISVFSINPDNLVVGQLYNVIQEGENTLIKPII